MKQHELLTDKASQIKLLILDVDGVLTDGKIWLNSQGEEIKNFYVQDGLGIVQIQRAGIAVAIISGRSSPAVSHRMRELKVSYVFQGCQDKLKIFNELLLNLNLTPEQVAYMGDDLPDLPIMQRVGFSIAVANAVQPVKEIAHWQTNYHGGAGAVREVCDLILSCQKIKVYES